MTISSVQLPPDIPEEAIAFLERVGYFEPDMLKPGDAPPALALQPLSGGPGLQIPVEGRPNVLIFGSFT